MEREKELVHVPRLHAKGRRGELDQSGKPAGPGAASHHHGSLRYEHLAVRSV